MRLLLAMPTGTEAASDAANASDLANTLDRRAAIAKRRIQISACAAAAHSLLLVVVFFRERDVAHAIRGMGISLYVFWFIIGGCRSSLAVTDVVASRAYRKFCAAHTQWMDDQIHRLRNCAGDA